MRTKAHLIITQPLSEGCDVESHAKRMAHKFPDGTVQIRWADGSTKEVSATIDGKLPEFDVYTSLVKHGEEKPK